MANTRKKSSKQKRILIASILIAAAITVGGTFAWFTSQDSVTNRLTANADYGVSITEDFTPPENWVPGQTIDKNVGAVNTGNVSAFVKLTVSNALSVTYESESTQINTANDTITVPSETSTVKNVTLNGDGKSASDPDDSPDEVLAAKAGGVLVYTTNTTDAAKAVTVDSAKGVGTELTPSGSGLYIFRRAVNNDFSTTEGSAESYEYDGFYYDGTSYYKITGIDPSFDITNTTTVTSCTFKFVTETTSASATPSLEYEVATTVDSAQVARIKATYSRDSGTTDDDIVIYINLQSNWETNYAQGSATEYYLKSILAPGATAADLIDSVELSSETKQSAYKELLTI